MRLVKTEETLSFDETKFSPPIRVQGGTRRSFEDLLLIESGGRFKLFTEGTDLIAVLSGEGHFKWARGETPFRAGDAFLAENLGEYELNGKGKFLIKREER